jgi:hypothetical protein
VLFKYVCVLWDYNSALVALAAAVLPPATAVAADRALVICCPRSVHPSGALSLSVLPLHRLDEYGVPFLQFFLKQCNTLTALDVSNNQMGDFLCGDVLQCLARPPLDFDDGDGKP